MKWRKAMFQGVTRGRFWRRAGRVFLFLLLFQFVFADFIANDKPLVAHHSGGLIFPVVHQYFVNAGWAQWPKGYETGRWKEADLDWVIWPPIPYGRSEQDVANPRVGPMDTQHVKNARWRHWLGTDDLGRDLLSAMIHSVRIDLLVGLVAMAVATFLGIFFGGMAGYFGDNRIRISRAHLMLGIIALPFMGFYAFQVRQYVLLDGFRSGPFSAIWQLLISLLIITLIALLVWIIGKALNRIPALKKPIRLPLDQAVSRLIEVTVSIPVLFLVILVLSLVAGGSLFWVMVVIGLTRWTGIARLTRAELLRIRELEYVEAARTVGLPEGRILLRHALPNAMGPVLVAVAFGIANAILLEGFLSFIGLGVPPDVLTWGSLMNMGRSDLTAWWLTVFPGLALFLTVLFFNLWGEFAAEALDPRLKR